MESVPSDKENQSGPKKELDLFGRGSAKREKKEESEAAAMLARIFEMQRDLKEKLDYIHEKGKQCHIDTDLFFKTSIGEISQFDILNLKEKQSALLKNLETPTDTKQQPAPAPIPQSADKLTKERKGKLRGARNKWIPLQ